MHLHKRFFVTLLMISLVVVLAVVPAFGVSYPGMNNYISAFPFDVIGFDDSDGFEFPWVGRSTTGYPLWYGAEDAESEARLWVCNVYGDFQKINGNFSIYSNFYFGSDQMLWKPTSYFRLRMGDVGSATFDRVVVSFELAKFQQGVNGSYQVSYVPITYDSFNYGQDSSLLGSEIDINAIIKKAFERNRIGIDDSKYYFIRNVIVNLSWSGSSDFEETVYFESNVSQDFIDDPFQIWINQQNLQIEFIDPDFNFFDWIKDSVSSLFDLEIVPGISINTLFYIALVIGIAMFVLKAIH